MRRFARWLATRLLDSRDGKPRAPGSSATFTASEVNGTSFTVLSNGESFDIFQGYGQIYAFALSSRVVLQFARFVIRWWIVNTWCGLKPRLWRWAQRRSSNGDRS